jgi:hypothetical protein
LIPVVAYNSTDNQFLVVWWDKRNSDSGDIYARLVNGDGTMDGSDFPISTSSAEQGGPAVAYDPNANQYLVVWEHTVYDTDIYGRLVNADESFVGPEFPISTGSDDHSDPAVALDADNDRFLVAWSDSGGWDDIHAQLVNADGSMDGDRVDLATGKGDFFYPDTVLNSSTKQFLVVWRHETCFSFTGCDDNDKDIYGAIYPETVDLGVYLPLVVRDAAPDGRVTHGPIEGNR